MLLLIGEDIVVAVDIVAKKLSGDSGAPDFFVLTLSSIRSIALSAASLDKEGLSCRDASWRNKISLYRRRAGRSRNPFFIPFKKDQNQQIQGNNSLHTSLPPNPNRHIYIYFPKTPIKSKLKKIENRRRLKSCGTPPSQPPSAAS